jgi:hypothetical protein
VLGLQDDRGSSERMIDEGDRPALANRAGDATLSGCS